MTTFSQAIRGLRRAPTFTIAAILTVALAMAATTAIAGAIESVLLRPLPTHDIDQLVSVEANIPDMALMRMPLSPGEVFDLEAHRELFQDVGAYRDAPMNLTGAGQPQRVAAVSTIGQFFTVFGARPLLGRLYDSLDVERDKNVAVLSYASWRTLTGADSSVIGRGLELDGERFTVVGVLREGFDFPHHTQLWTPHPAVPGFDSRDNWCCKVATAVARLRTGVTADRASAALANISRGWREKYPQIYSVQSGAGTHSQTLTTAPLAQTLAGELRPILLLLAVAVGLLTLIACANVASLQLVRATTRLRETALRVALGASRSAIVRLASIESLVIAIVGGALGLLLGAGALAIARQLPGFESIFSQSTSLDWRVAAFSAVTSLVVALAFGIAPALVASHVDPNALLTGASRSATGGRRGNRLLSGAVVVQMSLALLLLFAAGLSIRSLQRLLTVDLGFKPEHVMRMRLSLTSTKYPGNPARISFEHALIERLRAMPGTIAVGTVSGGPFSYLKENEASTILKAPSGVEVHASIWIVGGDYFRAMQIPLRAGRVFDASDVSNGQSGPRTWIVDETLARQLFPGKSAMSQSDATYQANIIGEVGAIKKSDLANANTPSVYWTYDEAPQPTVSAVVRTSLDASVAMPMMRTAVHELDPDLPVFDLMPLEQGIDDSLAPRRIGLDVLAVFAAMSLVLAALGVYGVASYGTTRRSREIGIRIALGADVRRVTSDVLGDGVRLLAIAVGSSVVIVLIAGRALQAFVFGVSTHDWPTLVAGIVAIGCAALGATWIPARRAARIDPAVTLRTE